MDDKLRSAIDHYLTFSLRPGPFWKLPPSLDRLLVETANEAMGASWWDDPLIRERLDKGFDILEEAGRGRLAIDYDDDLLKTYTFGYVPLHFQKTAEVLTRIHARRAFPEHVRILDLACGPGTASLSAAYFFMLLGNARGMLSRKRVRYSLDIVQADRFRPALEFALKLTNAFAAEKNTVNCVVSSSVQLDLRPEPSQAEAAFSAAGFDIILVQNLLGELRQLSVTNRRDIIIRLGRYLNPGGFLVLIENSSHGRAQEFHQVVSKSVESPDGGLHVLAPCPAIFGEPRGLSCYSCSGFVHRGIVRPRFLEKLSKASSRYDFIALTQENTWCYAVLGNEEPPADAALPDDRSSFSPLGGLFDSLPERADFLVSIAAQDPGRAGTYKICDQSCGAESCVLNVPPVLAVAPLECGDVVSLKNVRVEKEEDEDEGNIRFQIHLDEQSSILNLTRSSRVVTWSEAVRRAGYNA